MSTYDTLRRDDLQHLRNAVASARHNGTNAACCDAESLARALDYLAPAERPADLYRKADIDAALERAGMLLTERADFFADLMVSAAAERPQDAPRSAEEIPPGWVKLKVGGPQSGLYTNAVHGAVFTLAEAQARHRYDEDGALFHQMAPGAPRSEPAAVGDMTPLCLELVDRRPGTHCTFRKGHSGRHGFDGEPVAGERGEVERLRIALRESVANTNQRTQQLNATLAKLTETENEVERLRAALQPKGSDTP